MKAGAIVQRGGPVARSLKITGTTHAMFAAFSAGAALNGAVAALALGVAGDLVVVAAIFSTLALCSAAVSADVLNRSSKAVADLRSMGASRAAISTALFGAVVIYGAAGAAIGGLAGAGLGSVLLGSSIGTRTALVIIAVVGASTAAQAAGSYAGGRSAWRS